jgi:hypothetical protein
MNLRSIRTGRQSAMFDQGQQSLVVCRNRPTCYEGHTTASACNVTQHHTRKAALQDPKVASATGGAALHDAKSGLRNGW